MPWHLMRNREVFSPTSLMRMIAIRTACRAGIMPILCFFEAEKKRVFAAGWVAVGHASEIAKPGMYMTVTIGDEPVIIMRNRDGSIRASSNICRHRGMRLLEGRGRVNVITCPYHAWSYDLDGSLSKAPYMDEVDGFDAECHSLPQFAVSVNGMVLFSSISAVMRLHLPRIWLVWNR